MGITMKKLVLIILSVIFMPTYAFANDIEDIKAAFNNYINDANSYSKNLPNNYIQNAKIIRVINKKRGGQQSIVIPYDRYLKELKANSTLAKAVNYKNKYTNIKITKYNDFYKLTATRIPRNDKTGLFCYFIYVNENGKWKIKEESMTTNVQAFLSAK